VRDGGFVAERQTATLPAIWLWDDRRGRIVWAGRAMLEMLDVADLSALCADPIHLALTAASRRIVPGGPGSDIVLQRGARVLQGAATATRIVLPDGRPGLRITWEVVPPQLPVGDAAIEAQAFAAAPSPMVVIAADGVPLTANAAFDRAFGGSAGAFDQHGLTQRGWGVSEVPLDHGLTLLSLTPPQAHSAVVEAAALSRIAHEFRSPLTAVVGFAEFLNATIDDLSPERARGYLADLATAAERMRRLADDLVALGNGPSGLRIAETPLDALIATAVRLAAPLAGSRGVTIAAPGPSGLLALADADALGRAVANLLDNAIRHGTPAGGTVTLRLVDGGRAEGAAIEVADSGPGLSAEALVEALAPYGRPGERADAAAGGLGLPIVREIAEAHGGRLAITTAPGQGLCATIHLPPGRVFRVRPPR
jgi:signal transduction histidine kinase